MLTRGLALVFIILTPAAAFLGGNKLSSNGLSRSVFSPTWLSDGGRPFPNSESNRCGAPQGPAGSQLPRNRTRCYYPAGVLARSRVLKRSEEPCSVLQRRVRAEASPQGGIRPPPSRQPQSNHARSSGACAPRGSTRRLQPWRPGRQGVWRRRASGRGWAYEQRRRGRSRRRPASTLAPLCCVRVRACVCVCANSKLVLVTWLARDGWAPSLGASCEERPRKEGAGQRR